MRKILFVANVAKEHINKFHIPTIKFFKSQGWQVDVACGGNDDIPECDNRYYGKWKRSPFRIESFLGVSQLRKIIKRNSYDVVYCHTPVGGLVARLAVLFLKNKPKVVYFAHGFHFYKGGPKIAWLTIYPIEKFLSRYTDLLITLNREDYDFAIKKMAKEAKVILSPGVGVNFQRLSIENKDKIRNEYRERFGLKNEIVLIYIAELIPNKNQGMLLSVLKNLSEKREDIVLLLVGPDHADGRYQKQAEKLGLTNKVFFTGWRSDIGELLAMSDICVASSIREGFGINLVEAMYAGLPVVAVKNRGHGMIVSDGENGFLVPLNDAKAMSERILQIIEDPPLREKLSNVDVEQYDAEVIAQNLYLEINSLVQETACKTKTH